MPEEPSRAIRLYGTEEPLPERRVLRAGPLECTLEAGNLRWIRLGGVEAIRSLAYIVRDRNWGTYNPEIRDLRVEERADGFTVRYEATARDAAQAYRYRARIEGRADGSLLFEGEGEALTDFVTNRTGFVVLHPVGVSGRPLTVEHTDGRVVESRFPELVDPLCPFQDIRALTHEVLPGVRLRCLMEGGSEPFLRFWRELVYVLGELRELCGRRLVISLLNCLRCRLANRDLRQRLR